MVIVLLQQPLRKPMANLALPGAPCQAARDCQLPLWIWLVMSRCLRFRVITIVFWTVASSWTNTEGPLAYRPNYCSYNVYEPLSHFFGGNDWIEIGNGPQRNWCYPEQGSIWSYTVIP